MVLLLVLLLVVVVGLVLLLVLLVLLLLLMLVLLGWNVLRLRRRGRRGLVARLFGVADGRAVAQAGQLAIEHGAVLRRARGVPLAVWARVVLRGPFAAGGEAPKPGRFGRAPSLAEP
jgi:hypothetical protein